MSSKVKNHRNGCRKRKLDHGCFLADERRIEKNALLLFPFQHQNHSLKLSASEIAALSGFHPFANLPQMLLNHVYQGHLGGLLQQQDANLLGLELVSEQEQLLQLAQKSGNRSLTKSIHKALQVQQGTTKLNSIQQVQQLSKQVEQETQAASSSSRLNPQERQQLTEAARHATYTGFGSCWEDDALDLYALQLGSSVYARNEHVRSWPFCKSDNNGSNRCTVQPMSNPVVEESSYRQSRMQKEESSPSPLVDKESSSPKQDDESKGERSNKVIDLSESSSSEDDDDDDGSSKSNDNSSSSTDQNSIDTTKEYPFFILRGSIDGLRDETIIIGKKESSPVVVECKHRMNKFYNPPPLYEQIQATAYCFLYGTTKADILQVLRTTNHQKKKKKNTNEKKPTALDKFLLQKENAPNKNENGDHSAQEETADDSAKEGGERVKQEANDKKNENLVQIPRDDNGTSKEKVPKKQSNERSSSTTTTTTMQLQVSTLSIDDPLYQHGQNFWNVILPRLRQWTEMVYQVRSSDEKRYRLLHLVAGAPAEQSPQIKEAWESIIFQECPWFKDCDVAYYRENMG